MSSLLPTPLPFWPKDTPKPSNDSWLQWRKTFEDYIELLPILSPTIVLDVPSKLKLLRTNLGELGRYFDALNLQKAIDLQTAFLKLESAWGGKDNVFLSRYRFCQMRQESNQCVSDFITNLTLAIQDCGYKDIKADNFEHAMLIQQLIVGLRDEKARENLLSEKNDLSWEKACDIASHQERVRQNLQQLNLSSDGVIAALESEMAVSLVNTAVSSPRQQPSAPSKQLPSCYRCGQHHIRWSDCRHQKTVCQFCKKVGHIERVCFSKRRANSNTHATYPSPAGDGEAILRMFPANATLQSPYTITLPVDHHPVKFEMDTGSAVTLINEASLQKLPSLLPASSTFRSYTGQNVDVRGVFTAEVEHDGELHYLPVHVVRGSQQPNLLGRNWIKCVPSVPSYVHRIGVNPALDSVLVNHKDLFRDDSATHYRGPLVKFQFQSDFRPRFFKARTVPYALAPKVEEELDRLQKADIIEPVQYSEWAAPIVPVLKTDGSVRICGGYKLTINSATKLNPYPLPRIEDLRPLQASMCLSTTTVHGLHFADDCALNAETEDDMQRSMKLFASDYAHFGFNTNTDKTVVMYQPPLNAAYSVPPIHVDIDEDSEIGAAVYEANIFAVVKSKMKVLKSQAPPTSRVNIPPPPSPLPTCPRRQRILRSRIHIHCTNHLTIPITATASAPCSNPHDVHEDAYTHQYCSGHPCPANSIISDRIAAATITSTILAIHRNAPSDTPATTLTYFAPISKDVASVPTSPYCHRKYVSRIGTFGHLRINRTGTGEPVPGSPTYAHHVRLRCPHCTHEFTHHAGLCGHVRVHEKPAV
nr:unnamed protein product [Spirometra erinaceieuropaei]